MKYISVDDDWILRATGDFGCRQLTLFSSGVLASLPDRSIQPSSDALRISPNAAIVASHC